jgi:hypothetical protein
MRAVKCQLHGPWGSESDDSSQSRTRSPTYLLILDSGVGYAIRMGKVARSAMARFGDARAETMLR